MKICSQIIFDLMHFYQNTMTDRSEYHKLFYVKRRFNTVKVRPLQAHFILPANNSSRRHHVTITKTFLAVNQVSRATTTMLWTCYQIASFLALGLAIIPTVYLV